MRVVCQLAVRLVAAAVPVAAAFFLISSPAKASRYVLVPERELSGHPVAFSQAIFAVRMRDLPHSCLTRFGLSYSACLTQESFYW
jgi:hypothetical protein